MHLQTRILIRLACSCISFVLEKIASQLSVEQKYRCAARGEEMTAGALKG